MLGYPPLDVEEEKGTSDSSVFEAPDLPRGLRMSVHSIPLFWFVLVCLFCQHRMCYFSSQRAHGSIIHPKDNRVRLCLSLPFCPHSLSLLCPASATTQHKIQALPLSLCFLFSVCCVYCLSLWCAKAQNMVIQSIYESTLCSIFLCLSDQWVCVCVCLSV